MTDVEVRLGELLKDAMGRQRIGADQALDELVAKLTSSEPRVACRRPAEASWHDPDEAERHLRRFLQDFPA